MTTKRPQESGASVLALGDFNRIVVLDAVRRTPEGLSRVEIAQRTGLSPQAISNVVRHLLDQGLVTETGTQVHGRGKPRTILQLRARSRYALGVHIDPSVTTYAVTDLSGTTVVQATTSTPPGDPERIGATIASALRELGERAGISQHHVLGVGVASPGPIDSARGVILDPPHLPGWRHIPLRDDVARLTGLPVLLEKDVAAAAVGEMWKDVDGPLADFAYVYFGTGIGLGIVSRKELLRGDNNNAGDLGRVIIERPELLRGDERYGEVGETVEPANLIAKAAGHGLSFHSFLRGVRMDGADLDRAFTELNEFAVTGDPIAKAVCAQAGTAMARAAIVAVNLLDINRVVFGGPFWSRISPWALPAARAVFAGSPVLSQPRSPVDVRDAASLGVTALGAACLVLDDYLSPRSSSLLIQKSTPAPATGNRLLLERTSL